MTLSRTNPRAKGRWALLGIVIVVGLLFTAAVTQAQLDTTLFELDKDATDDTTSTKVGVLNAAVATAADGATTSIQICQAPATFGNGTVILVDAERMSLASGATATGGGCPSSFPNKRSYTATRGLGTTVPGAHAKAEDVSLITTGAFDGDDWDKVYDEIVSDPDSTCAALGAVECAFSQDGRAMSVFTQSKDYDEISDDNGATSFWKWRDQSVPDADELDDGFAVKYVDTDGEQHLFFGADRFAVNGTKDAGFWFFHDEVGPVPAASGDSTFTGVHTPPDPGLNGVFCGSSATPVCSPYDADDSGGDILILTTFTGGGAVTTVRVFEWIGPAGSTAALLERAAFGDCQPGPAGSLCATVNDTTIETKWPYSGKSEPALNQVASGGFLEGGVNLTDLGLEGCFSSFMATSRSSASLTADPKDFILGSFEACDTEVTTTPKTGAGSALTADTDEDNLDEIQIGTDGTVAVKDSAELEVKGTTTFTGSLSFYVCGPFDNPAACDDSGVLVNTIDPVTANGTYLSDAVTLTSVGRYCWFAFFDSGTDGVPDASDGTIESPGDAGADPPIPYSTGECFEVTPVTPTLTTTSVECEEVENGDTTVVCTQNNGPIDFGEELYDEADLNGTANQPGDNGGTIPDDPASIYPSIEADNGDAASGTITFHLYGPLPTDPADFENQEAFDAAFEAACDTLATGFPSGGITRTVDGDGLYNTFGDGFAPGEPGLYAWKAAYDGSDPNTTAAPLDADGNPTQHNADCDDPNEAVEVRQIPTTISTAQSVYPNDSATVASSETGVNLPGGGTVTFRLYAATPASNGTPAKTALENCLAHGTTLDAGGLIYEESKSITGDTESETVSTSNSTEAVSADAIVYWWVTYDPADDAFSGRQSDCVENTDIDFTNHAGPGDLFPTP